MISSLKQVRYLVRPRTRWRAFCDAPAIYQEHFRYAMRCALQPEFRLQMWVTSPSNGTEFFLSKDLIDDAIASEIVSRPERLFPNSAALTGVPGVILDLGGHHGLYAAEALRRYPDRNLVVVEPHPFWCDLIRKNLERNGGAGRSRVVNACLAPDCSKRMLRFSPNSSWGATVQAVGGGEMEIEVESLRLPDILRGEAVAMIYCNAEGAEYTLVSQMRRHAIRPAAMVLCVHPEYGDVYGLCRELHEAGYTERDVSVNGQRPVFHYTLGAGA